MKKTLGRLALLFAIPVALSAGEVMKVAKADFRESLPPGSEWTLIWNDEFNGQSIDERKWHVQSLRWEWPGIATKQKDENCALDGNGHLAIKLTRDADGTIRYGRGVVSDFKHSYGYYEVRVQFTKQPGWWSGVWLAGHLADNGPDPFVHPQEIDIFEDFYKPKKVNDIAQSVHFGMYTSLAGTDTTRVGYGDMLHEKIVRRVSHGSGSPSSRKIILEDYDGWHTVGMEWSPLGYTFYVDGKETHRQSYREVPVTTAPMNILITAELRTPTENAPFFGRLENAELPDQLLVDYIRVYDKDLGGHKPPSVSLSRRETGDSSVGKSEIFEVEAKSSSSVLERVCLFSMGRLRAECPVSDMAVKTEFKIDSLFPNFENTVVAMVKDKNGLVGISNPVKVDVNGPRMFTGTAYKNRRQEIPGRILAGHYDEGGNGVAYLTPRVGTPDARCDWRPNEIVWSSEAAIPCGCVETQWVTYRVDVKAAGEYDVELFMNRPDYEREGVDFSGRPDDAVQLDIDKVKVAEWSFAAEWTSGAKWREPLAVGKRRVTLTAGEHQLLLRFNRVNSRYTFFGGLDFTPAK